MSEKNDVYQPSDVRWLRGSMMFCTTSILISTRKESTNASELFDNAC